MIAGIAVIIPPAEGEALIGTEPQAWLDAAIGMGKVVYALAPYVALAVFLAVVTQSTAQGISISMGYYLLELIAAPLIGGIAGWLENVLDVALLGSNVGEWMSTANTTDTLQGVLRDTGVHRGLRCRRALDIPAKGHRRRKGGVTRMAETA